MVYCENKNQHNKILERLYEECKWENSIKDINYVLFEVEEQFFIKKWVGPIRRVKCVTGDAHSFSLFGVL